MNYTEDQQKAIKERGRNILVAAAAGSGKTRVLVERIIRQLIDGECDVDEMLIVTFTNAAAAEMRERIEQALQQLLQDADDSALASRLERQVVLLTGADICTFHSFCQKVIRQYIDRIDVDPQFRLATEQEMVLLERDTLESVMEQAYERPSDEESLPDWQAFLSFVDDYGDEQGDESVFEAVEKLYHFCQSQPCPEDWLRRQQEAYAAPDSFWRTGWGKSLLPEIRRALDDIIRDYEAAAPALKEDDGAAVRAAWEPYAKLMQQDLEQLEEVRSLLQGFQHEQTAGQWDALCRQTEKVSWTAMRKKEYKELKESFPAVWNAFISQRNAVKKRYQEKFRDKYFRDSEQDIVCQQVESGKTVCAYIRLTLAFMDALRRAKRERNILDFSDLEHGALAVLCADLGKLQQDTPSYVPAEPALELRQQFKTIMVDEYQDTNSVQEAILSLIARPANRFTVGDVKQSIYRFRLADPHLFQEKYDRFPEQPSPEDRNLLITMKQNFRSRAEVLAPINFLFDQIMTREAAEIEYDVRSRLYPGAFYPEHEHTLRGPAELDIILSGASSDSDAPEDKQEDNEEEESLEGFRLEAQRIADRIGLLIGSQTVAYDKDSNQYRPVRYRDIAILLRAVRGKANILLEVLRSNGIPAYADVDGGYFEATEVRLILSLLSLIDNVRQDIPLAAVLASPIGGFSMEDLARIRLAAGDGMLYDGLLAACDLSAQLPSELSERAAAFQQELSGWRRYAMSHSVPELIWRIYRDTGYYDYVAGLKGGILRQANLRMLTDRAADYERTNYRGLFRFLRFIENLKKRDTDLSTARTLGASEDVVRIMSIHKSKGLEFPVVFVSDIAKGFNFREAKGNFLMHQDLGIGVKLAERTDAGRQIFATMPWKTISSKITEESRAEEMRVLYVAMTRAREKLILTGTIAENRMQSKAADWGRYVDGEELQLPAGFVRRAGSYLDWIVPAIARHPDGDVFCAFAGVTPSGDVRESCRKAEPDAHFSVRLLRPAEIGRPQEKNRDDEDPLLIAAEHLAPMPASERKEQVEFCLSWQYDMRGLEHIPAKVTVTELKHRFAENDSLSPEEINGQFLPMTGDEAAAGEADWPRPRFLQEMPNLLSAAERGTIMHIVMQHLDFQRPLTFQEVRRQIRIMEEKQILRPGWKEAVYIKGILQFAGSPLGQRLRHCQKVWRELPFSRMLPACRFFPEAEEKTEQVFLQGVIDLLFEEEDGTLILVDYKTDRHIRPEEARQKYRVQIDLYGESVEAILHRPVAERYVYLLQEGELVSMS